MHIELNRRHSSGLSAPKRRLWTPGGSTSRETTTCFADAADPPGAAATNVGAPPRTAGTAWLQ